MYCIFITLTKTPLLPSLSQGAQCKFRHCSAALGTEEVCDLWLRDQSCRRLICAFRHSVPEVSLLTLIAYHVNIRLL